MPIAGAVDLMAEVGVDAPSVRTAVFRLKENGWLVSETRDGARGYALTEHATATLAAGDQVIWHARQPAELGAGWCIVNVSVPESIRAKRYQLRSHLAHLGFGNVGTGMWIAPARMREQAEHDEEVRTWEGSDDLDPREAFARYVRLLDQWRVLPFRDPGLPREVLDPAWSAPSATALLERLVAVLEKPALKHAATYWPGRG